MDRTRPKLMESQKMELSAITFMLAEVILGKVGAEVTHHSIPRDFCDYTGGGDGKAQAVAIDNGGLRKGKGNYRQAVNQHVVGHAGQRRYIRQESSADCADFPQKN